jgi:hypothetical protein
MEKIRSFNRLQKAQFSTKRLNWLGTWSSIRKAGGLNQAAVRDRRFYFYIYKQAVFATKSKYENNHPTNQKFDEAFAFAAQSISHPGAGLVCAFAGRASGVPRRLLSEPKHRPRRRRILEQHQRYFQHRHGL